MTLRHQHEYRFTPLGGVSFLPGHSSTLRVAAHARRSILALTMGNGITKNVPGAMMLLEVSFPSLMVRRSTFLATGTVGQEPNSVGSGGRSGCSSPFRS